MGSVELDDQAAAVAWCVREGLADAARVGIYGWSYGGYLSAMALCKHPGVFKAAVSGAPVTSWDGYDSCYTERFMSLPQENASGYADASVMTHVHRMAGKLMLVHGMVDENVHFRHTARLITALTRARKEYELLLFPDERHLPRSASDRVYMEQRIETFFRRHL
jgi:dipeptidyl-peptidase 4